MKKYNNIIRKALIESINELVKKGFDGIDNVEMVQDNNIKQGGNFPIKYKDKTYWVSRSMVVTLYAFCQRINENGEREWCILASKRGPKVRFGRNKWNAVMGYLDYGETLEEGAVREAFEETGVKINPKILHREVVNSKRNRDDVTVGFSAILPGLIDKYPTTISNSEEGEVTEARWIPFSEITNLPWMGGQGAKILEASRTILGRNESIETNDDYKNIVTSLKNLLNQDFISYDVYEQIIKTLNNK